MEKNNTQKGIVQFAMEAGAYMGLYFVVKFIFAVLSLNYPFCNVVSTIMLLFVPVVVFFMMRKFSNQNCFSFLPRLSVVWHSIFIMIISIQNI